MFESVGLDAADVLAAAEANLRDRRAAEVDLLRIAAAWADLHPPEWQPPPVDEEEQTRRRLADEEPVLMGGDGTPTVIGFCPGELGLILETTYTGAKHLIADALDLRYRLPKLWATVQSGRVAAWKARRVAAATRALTVEQAAEVDEGVHAVIATLGWTRFELILDATLKRADPDTTQAAEHQAATRRFVAAGRANDHHIMTLIARGTSLDILSFLATVNRIADILHSDGDTDPVEVRRSKAIGILARPAKALELLAAHHNPPTPTEDKHADEEEAEEEPDPEHDGHVSLHLDRSPLGLPLRPCRCGPRIQLYVHLSHDALSGTSGGVCRIEGLGPLTVATLRTWLGRSDASIDRAAVLTPDQPAANSYEIPPRHARSAPATLPRQHLPLVPDPGPHPRCRPHPALPAHRPRRATRANQSRQPRTIRPPRTPTQTFGHLKVRQPAPGIFLWRSRHGWIWLVTNTGTHPLGRSPTAHAIWHAAAPQHTRPPAVIDLFHPRKVEVELCR